MNPLETMAELLDEASREFCREFGGYPDDVQVVGDYVVAAHLASDIAILEVHSKEKVVAWLKAYRKYHLENPDADMSESLDETEPTEQDAQGVSS